MPVRGCGETVFQPRELMLQQPHSRAGMPRALTAAAARIRVSSAGAFKSRIFDRSMTLTSTMPAALSRALENKGYSALTEVQEGVLAPEAAGRDLLVSAQTGSGKTVAFGLAIAGTLLGERERFEEAGLPLALIVAPTRELALQVQRELDWLYAEAGGRIASCVGGMDPRAERRALERGAHIVVGTPGRLRDHIERGALDMGELRAVVLDEADEMLDFGFREDLEFILDAAPAGRRTLLFSATVPHAISEIARRYQRDALRLSTVSERGQHADIAYQAFAIAPPDKENAIINLLRYHEAERALVFCATREAVNRLASRFGNRGFAAVALSGELSQSERTHALQALRDGRARVCIATDVAARGIDLPGLELVIHADLPTNSDVLKHRSGRTGRAGRKGVSALLVPFPQRSKATRLLKGAGLTAQWAEMPGPDEIAQKDRERLFSDPAFTAEHSEERLELARALVERFGAEALAAALLARREEERPAPEDLIAPGPAAYEPREKRDRAPREDFGEGVWFRVNAGHKQRAEPRWLLPLICRLGHVTRREVGQIEIGQSESRFEIRADAAAKFKENLAASGGGEKSVRITAEGGEAAPLASAPAPRERGERSEGISRERGERSERRPREDRAERPRFEKSPRPDRKAGGAGFKPRTSREEGEDRPVRKGPKPDRKAGASAYKPREAGSHKPSGKPAGKPGAKREWPPQSGSIRASGGESLKRVKRKPKG